MVFQPKLVPRCAFIPPSVCQISRQSDNAFEFYSRFCKCATRKRKRRRRKKNEETQSIFEVAYLGNARSDFAQIWNVECCSWGACPQQKSSCFIKEAQSYGGAKIAFSFFLSIYSRVLRAGFLGRTTHYRVS